MIGLGPRGHLGTSKRDDGIWEAICWAPRAQSVAVRFLDGIPIRIELAPAPGGYFAGEIGERTAGERYWFELDGGARVADPASRSQPEGVHGPSALVDLDAFTWTDDGFEPSSMRDTVIYELHIGAFRAPVDPTVPGGRRPGTFATAAAAFGELRALGVTAVEPMPVAAFPGARNWGYDGVFPFAVQESYGGPAGFQRFVDAAHSAGLSVILDVVYNHLGPEGAVQEVYGPYTSDQYATPWGPAMNVDRASSDEVRRYLLENAVQWFVDFHVDGLRLDAIHGIIDTSAKPFFAELSELTASLGDALDRPLYLIAESEDNNPRVLSPTGTGGLGMDGQWADDFHHALHVSLTGERRGYYADYAGTGELAKAIGTGFAYVGQHSVFRQRRHGATPVGTVPAQFCVCAQNHDQVGNRPGSERLSTLVSPQALRVASGVLCLSPHTPLLFMGEEDGEQRPFAYFVDHSDPDLLAAVREGRAAEMGEEGSLDPGAPETFAASCLDPATTEPDRLALRRWYTQLLAIRASTPIITDPVAHTESHGADGALSVVRRSHAGGVWFAANFGESLAIVEVPSGAWSRLVDAGDPVFGGEGTPSPRAIAGPGSITLARESFVCYLDLEEDRDA